MAEVIIALDQGSSSSRALAFDRSGRVLASAQRPVRTAFPRPGWSEQDPLELAQSLESALDSVLAALPRRCEVAALALACQRSTVVLWDAATGRPLAAAATWQDGRAAGVVEPLQRWRRLAHRLTGLYLTPYYSAPKVRWLLDRRKRLSQLRRSGRLRVGPVACFALWRLTGGALYAADPTLAQRMLLLNLRSLDWDSRMLGLFGLDRDLLPEVRASAGDWGFAERAGRRLPVRVCVGDQQAAAIALGAGESGRAVANYGTGAFVLHNTGAARRQTPGLLTSVGGVVAGRPATFFQEGTVHAAGSSVDWLRRPLGLLGGGEDLDAACRSSRHRVFALPAIGGLGAPRWDYVTKTAFFGLTSQTSRADLVRAVAEGLAFLVADIVEALRAQGGAPPSARVSGGLSRSACLMQFQSDILEIPLERCSQPEATALGAASLAAESLGEAEWARRLRQPGVDRVFRPRMPRARARALRRQWRAFVEAQAALSRRLRG